MSVTTTDHQRRMAALERANHVRLARAELKRKIQAGEQSVPEILLDQPAEIRNWPISELLRSQRGWGARGGRQYNARSSKLLRSLKIPELKTAGALTERQRRVLVEALTLEGARR